MASFDVFLSHASSDKAAVEALAHGLRDRGLRPFLDRWHLVPGEPWQEALEDALADSRACAVFVGPTGLGPWQNEEMRVALDRRARSSSFRVVPVLLPGAGPPDDESLPAFLRRLTWLDLRAGTADASAVDQLIDSVQDRVAGASAPTPPATRFRAMVNEPEDFVHRQQLVEIRDLLLATSNDEATVGITTALRGAGGFGKTTLAQALAHDERVREAFPDGVLWVTMGDGLREADRLARVRDLLRWWHPVSNPIFETLQAARARLKEVLNRRQVLMIVDDVWQSEDVEIFRGVGAAQLVTTRNAATLPAGCRRVDVDAMTSPEAVRLLSTGLQLTENDRENLKINALVRRLGEWPLLLKLVNRQLRQLAFDDGLSVNEALTEVEDDLAGAGVTAFDVIDDAARDRAVERTLEVSMRRLDYADRERFTRLAVFIEDADVPVSVVARLWEVEASAARRLCRRLHDLSLLLRFDRRPGDRTIRLHDVVRQYLLTLRREHRENLHQLLLERCRPASGNWADLPATEAYWWRHLAHHLILAGEHQTLRRLLRDFAYLETKLAAIGIVELLADFVGFENETELRLVRDVLRLGSHILTRDLEGDLPGQLLAGQLLGRLTTGGDHGLTDLLAAARQRARLLPRHRTLVRPGGALQRTLEGHRNAVTALACLDAGDGPTRRVVSASWDETARVWDLATGETLRILEGHSSNILAVAVLGSGGARSQRIVTASLDRTVRVWDAESGELVGVLKGHTSAVNALAVLDERRIVSASGDRTLRVWDLDSGEQLQALVGHRASVIAVLDAASPSAHQVVLAAADKTLRVWDLDCDAITTTVKIRDAKINALAVLGASGQTAAEPTTAASRPATARPATEQTAAVRPAVRVAVASKNGLITLWDLEARRKIGTLHGHTRAVEALAVLPAETAETEHLVSVSEDDTMRIWDVDRRAAIRVYEDATARFCALTALDATRVVSGSHGGPLRVWDVTSEMSAVASEGDGAGISAIVPLDATRMLSASANHTARVWDLSSGQPISTLEHYRARILVALDASRVVAAFGKGLQIWDLLSGKRSRSLRGHTGSIQALTALDDRRVASASSDGTVRIWDLESCQTIRTLSRDGYGFHDLAALGGDRLVTASYHQLQVWDLASGEEIRTHTSTDWIDGIVLLDAAEDSPHRVLFSVSPAIFSASEEALRVWDLDQDTVQLLDPQPAFPVHLIQVFDDHHLLYTQSEILRQWNLQTGETRAITAFDADIWSLAVAADRRTVLVGDARGGIHFLRLWRASETLTATVSADLSS